MWTTFKGVLGIELKSSLFGHKHFTNWVIFWASKIPFFVVLHLVLSEPSTMIYTSMVQSQSFSMTLRNALHSIVLVAVGWHHILDYLQLVLDSSFTVFVCSFDLGPWICLSFSAWCDFSVEIIVHPCCSLKCDVSFACGCFKIFLNFGSQQFNSQGLSSDFLWLRSTDLEFFGWYLSSDMLSSRPLFHQTLHLVLSICPLSALWMFLYWLLFETISFIYYCFLVSI